MATSRSIRPSASRSTARICAGCGIWAIGSSDESGSPGRPRRIAPLRMSETTNSGRLSPSRSRRSMLATNGGAGASCQKISRRVSRNEPLAVSVAIGGRSSLSGACRRYQSRTASGSVFPQMFQERPPICTIFQIVSDHLSFGSTSGCGCRWQWEHTWASSAAVTGSGPAAASLSHGVVRAPADNSTGRREAETRNAAVTRMTRITTTTDAAIRRKLRGESPVVVIFLSPRREWSER